VHLILDDHGSAEVLRQQAGDAVRPAVEEHELGEPLLHRQETGELAVRLGQVGGEDGFLLVPPGLVDRDRGVARERGEEVCRPRREVEATPAGVHVDRADRLTADDEG
jgi:hypothetical protein